MAHGQANYKNHWKLPAGACKRSKVMDIMKAEYERLKALYPYRIDMHVHNFDCTPEEQVRYYKEKGLDAFVMTNHFTGLFWRERETPYTDKERHVEWYLSNYRRAKAEGENVGVKVYLGMEVTFNNHGGEDFLVYGIEESDVYKTFDILDHYEKEDTGYLADLYKLVKNDKSLIVRAHPFRLPELPIGDLKYLDGIEVLNLSSFSSSDAAMKFARDNNITLLTAGSDCHRPEKNFAHPSIRVKKLPEDSFGVAEILKSGDYLLDADGFILLNNI